MIWLRLATGLALNRTAENRWRQAAVPFAALIFMTLVLASAATVAVVVRERDRDGHRMAQLSQDSPARDVLLL